VAALRLSNNREVEFGAALALALSGDFSRAQSLADDMDERFPEDTVVRLSYLPVLRARVSNPRRCCESDRTAAGDSSL
jgi:hypothetical protein